MSERFYAWLSRKYGFDREIFAGLDEDFQDVLVREYVSIVTSY